MTPLRLLVTLFAAVAVTGVTLVVVAEMVEAANPTWRVFATREGLVGHTTANGHVIKNRDHFVALPSRDALACNNCYNKQVKVCNPANGRCETAPVWDVGPWNTKDDYWNANREMFNDLPRGKPEAQAAYYDNYNGGRDMFGRTVLNPAGIDLADGTFWDGLGMTNNGWVDVTFLWIDIGDSTPPSKPSLSETHTGSSWSTHTSPRWSWSASDPQSGIKQYEVERSWGTKFKTTAKVYHPTLGTGAHSLRVRAQNTENAWGSWSNWVTARVDVTAPNAPVVSESHSGTGWSNHNSPYFSWAKPGDAGSGVASYTGYLDGSAVSLGSSRAYHPTLADGTHTFKVRAKDGVGLWSGYSATKTVHIDTRGPSSGLAFNAPWTSPSGDAYVGAATPFTVTASDALSGVAARAYRVDGGAWRSGTTFTLGAVADGAHTLQYRATDHAGNVGAAGTRVVRVDATPPTVSLPNPPDGSLVFSLDTVDVRPDTADALSGVARVELRIDGVLRATLAQGEGYAWRPGDEAAGNHVLRVAAFDRVGNSATVTHTVTTVPTTPTGLLATGDATVAAALAAAADASGDVPDPSEPPAVGTRFECPNGLPESCVAGAFVGDLFVGVDQGRVRPVQ